VLFIRDLNISQFLRTSATLRISGQIALSKRKFYSTRTLDSSPKKSWWRYYRNLVGVEEVRQARSKVIKKENEFVKRLQSTHEQEEILAEHWLKLNNSRFEVNRTSTVYRIFPPVLANELQLMKLEQQIQNKLANCNEVEKKQFLQFWQEVRNNMDDEIRRQKRRTGFVLMASAVGALIGIAGTATSYYLWNYFFSNFEDDALMNRPRDQSLRIAAADLAESVQARSRQFLIQLLHLRSLVKNLSTREIDVGRSFVTLADKQDELFPDTTRLVLNRVDVQTEEMRRIVDELRSGVQLSARRDSEVLIPIISLKQEDETYDSDIQPLWKVTLVYGILVMLLPLAFGAVV